MDDGKEKRKCRCECPFFKLFLSQLFEIGNSAGSLIGEAINLFRTFQRLSATKTFIMKFSSECNGMFDWAKDMIKIIISSLQARPFTDFELFWIYTISIPIFIVSFVSSLFNGYKQYRYFFLWAPFVIFGMGISMLSMGWIAYLVAGSGIAWFLIIIISYFACLKKKFAEVDKKNSELLEVQNNLHFTVSLLSSFTLLTVTLIPVLLSRKVLSVIIVIFLGSISVLSFFVEFVENCCYPEKQKSHFKTFAVRIVAFAISCLSLLIIPSTQNFAELMKGFYANKWNCIIGYLGITLIFPIVTTFFMIKTRFQGVCEKYKKNKSKINWYCYVELVDIIRQVVYAIVAAYDLPIVCICIEIAWFILILISRPYCNVSDYSLSFGNSLVVLMSNSAAVYSNYRSWGLFSFKTTVIFVIVACIPAVVSAYLFFIFDFNTKPDKSKNKKVNDGNLRAIYLISSIVGPAICFIIGSNLVIIIGGINY